MSAAGSVDSAKEGEETIVGKCYKPGCLQRAAHKCRGCLQVKDDAVPLVKDNRTADPFLTTKPFLHCS